MNRIDRISRRVPKLGFLWAFFALASVAPSGAHAQTPACLAADLQISFHLFDDPGNVERVMLLTRNISRRDCQLTASYPPNFVPAQQPNGPRIDLCQSCADRLPGGEEQARLPLLLTPGAFAHQSFRYRTSRVGDTAGCVQANWMSTVANDDMKHPILLVSKSLLKPICSAVDVVGYRSGLGDVTARDTERSPRERELTLRAERTTYYTDEWFAFQTDPQPSAKDAAPVNLLQERGPGGDTRLDEVQAGVLRGIVSSRHQSLSQEPAEIDSGARSRWGGLGDHSFQLFQVDGVTSTGEIRFLRSRPLTIQIADAAAISRTWGVTQQGVRVDLTLDRTQFQLGEDIAAHIAVQVVDAKEPVYGEPFLRGGAFFHSVAGSFHLFISDVDGPLENSERRANLYAFPSGSSGPSVCPGPLEAGKVVSLDRSLRQFGLLPRRPGTYRLSVAWSPYHSRFTECPNQRPDPAEQPFVTVTSNTVTITVVGDPPPTELPPFPEYAAWRARFSLVDTSFGELTALLDSATGLEWLRPSFTEGFNVPVTEQSLAARMAPGKDLFGWRFATWDEVGIFLADFTGLPDGDSHDPAAARKLLRLLGGTVQGTPDRQTGWIDNRMTICIAGLMTAPVQDPRLPSSLNSYEPQLWAHYAFIDDAVLNGQETVTITANESQALGNGPNDGQFVFEGGSEHHAGFFLVRQQ